MDKYILDLGWEQNGLCFVLYGCAGGSAEAKECTDVICEAIEKEIGEDFAMPIIIQGDYNRTPNEIGTIKRMIEEDAWTDLGVVASWWGGEDNKATCQTRPKAKATRIDGVVVNQYALPLVKNFEVI